MHLSELENFVIKKGILGCPLSEVPENLLDQINDSHALELVNHSINTSFPNNLLVKTPDSQVHQLEDLESFENIDIRFKFEMWRRLIFKCGKISSTGMAEFVQILMDNPNGLTKEQIYSKMSSATKRIKEWVTRLKRYDIIKSNRDFYTFNFDWLDGSKELPDDLFTSPGYCISFNQAYEYGFIDKIPERHITSYPNIIKDPVIEEKKGMKSVNLKQMPSPGRVNEILRLIKQYKHGIEIGILQEKLNLSKPEMNCVVDLIRKNKNFVVTGNGKASDKISYLGEMKISYLGPEMVEFLVDMCTGIKYFTLGDLPRDIRKMKTTMNLKDSDFVNILEDNGFNIIEIRSQYVNSEFVVFSPSIESDDPQLLEIFEKAREKVRNSFKSKVRYTFLKNVFMNSFDNNYLASFKERTNEFYKFVTFQIEAHDGYFYFNNSTLLNMKFSSFVKCVPLRSDFHFLKIAQDASIKYRYLKNTFNKFKKQKFEDLSPEDFTTLNSQLMEDFEKYTVFDVLNVYKPNSEDYNNLLARVDVHEFYRIILALVKFNIFEGFQTEDYYYLEGIDGIEKYVQRILTEIPDESQDTISTIVPYPIRKSLYEKICQFSEEEFYENAKKIIENSFEEGAFREFFLKKLNDFGC